MRLILHRGALWALCAAILAFAGLRLLWACDFGAPTVLLGLKYCPVPVSHAALNALRDARSELESEIHDNELKLARTPNCAPTGRPIPPAPQPLRIPTRLQDLKGCWVSDQGDITLRDVTSKQPVAQVKFCYCFDDDGRGTLKLRKNGQLWCEGPISVQLEGNSLHVDQPKFSCPTSNYADHIVDCKTNDAGAAICSRISREFPDLSVRAEGFHRAEAAQCD